MMDLLKYNPNQNVNNMTKQTKKIDKTINTVNNVNIINIRNNQITNYFHSNTHIERASNNSRTNSDVHYIPSHRKPITVYKKQKHVHNNAHI